MSLIDYTGRLPFELPQKIYESLSYRELMDMYSVNRQHRDGIQSYLNSKGILARIHMEKFIREIKPDNPDLYIRMLNEIDNTKLAKMIFYLNDYKIFDLKNIILFITETQEGDFIPSFNLKDENFEFIINFGNGQESWRSNEGERYSFHRLDGPAHITKYKGKTFKNWYVNGIKHRINGPAFEEFDENNILTREIWYKNDQIHRIGGPALFILKHKETSETIREWYKNGEKHNDDGPAVVRVLPGVGNMGETTISEWYIEGKKHNLIGPAYIEEQSGISTEYTRYIEKWFKNDILHRNYGPAITTSIIEHEGWGECITEWYEENKKHNIRGPAYVKLYLNNNMIGESRWFENNLPHRKDGPSIFLRQAGKIVKHWQVKGKHYRENNLPPRVVYKIQNEIQLGESEKSWYDDSDNIIKTINI